MRAPWLAHRNPGERRGRSGPSTNGDQIRRPSPPHAARGRGPTSEIVERTARDRYTFLGLGFTIAASTMVAGDFKHLVAARLIAKAWLQLVADLALIGIVYYLIFGTVCPLSRLSTRLPETSRRAPPLAP